MDILARLKKLEKLTTNEITLVDFIVKYPEKFLSMKPKEIANSAYVSVSTIYRLIDKLELNGINALKIELAASLRTEKSIISYDYPIVETDSHYEVVKNLKIIYEQTVQETASLIDFDILELITNLMLEAKVIDLYTASANLYFAENFKFQMQEIGVLVNVPAEDYIQRLSAANSDNSHLAIVVSYGGRGGTTKEVVKILHENKVKVVLITSTEDNPLRPYASYLLEMSSLENHYNKLSSFSTRISLLYLFDILYSIYFKKNYQNNLEYKLHNYQKINKKLK